MGAVYSTCFFQGLASPDGTTVGPFSGTVVVRDVEFTAPAAPAGVVCVDSVGAAIAYVVAGDVDAAGYASDHWTGRQVIEPGDTLTVIGLTGAESARVSGYLLGA